MNLLYMLIEMIFVYFILVLFYKFGKKDGLFLYIGFMAALLGVVMFKLYDFTLFPVNYGLPLIMGIFTANNIIIQRFGLDEIKKIISYYVVPYVMVMIIICLGSLVTSSDYNIMTNNCFNSLFGYGLINLRCFISGLLSIGFMLYLNGEVYYYIRRSKNKLLLSNIGSILIIQFIESIIFICVAYLGEYDFLIIFGMIIIRYLIKVIIGMVGLVIVYLLVNRRGK